MISSTGPLYVIPTTPGPALDQLPSRVTGLTLNLTSLAHSVTIAASVKGAPMMDAEPYAAGTVDTVVEVWENLTGLTGQDALDAAQAIAHHPHVVTGVVVPF